MNAKRHITATLVAATLGLGLTSGAEAAAIGFSLNEYSATNVLTTSLPGAAIIPTGPESWIVDLSATPVFLFTGLDRVWLDAEAGFINRVTAVDDKHLIAESDISLSSFQPTVDSYCGTGGPLPNGATCLIGYSSADTYYVTWTYPTPIPAAVWLFGSALGTLGWMRKRKLNA